MLFWQRVRAKVIIVACSRVCCLSFRSRWCCLPGAELPLHIFEDRYKEMIGEVIRDRVEFGVVLASEKGIVNTGCTAMIDKVLREYPDGRMDILTRGRRRFEIHDAERRAGVSARVGGVFRRRRRIAGRAGNSAARDRRI